MTAIDSRPVDDTWRVTSEEHLRTFVGPVSEMTREKKKPELDEHTRRFIDASPYVCVATSDGLGGADVSPRGDDRGFVRVIDNSTLALPERPGNRLADTLTNLIRDPMIGLLFLVPSSPECLRINGRAKIQHGPPSLLESLEARGRVPSLAIVVDIDEVFMHCGRAATRSRIWDRDMPVVDPRADRLIGEFLGVNEAAACEILAAYNSTDL